MTYRQRFASLLVVAVLSVVSLAGPAVNAAPTSPPPAEDSANAQKAFLSEIQQGLARQRDAAQEAGDLGAVRTLEVQLQNVESSGRLLAVTEQEGTSSERSKALVEEALRGQAESFGLDWGRISSLATQAHRRHDSPSVAALALLDYHGVQASQEVKQRLEELDELDSHLGAQIAEVIDAFINLERSASGAFISKSETGFAPGALEKVLAARLTLINAQMSLPGASSSQDDCDYITDGGNLFAIDPIGCSNIDDYDQDFALQIDLGGNDVYKNRAGGSGPKGELCTAVIGDQSNTAALVDVSGDDQYVSGLSNGVNGGSDCGMGLLLDRAGADIYDADSMGVNGGALGEGQGALIDLGDGVDTYKGKSYGVNGGATGPFSSGLLIDERGKSTYEAIDSGNGGASGTGDGRLIDAGGNDTFRGTAHNNNGGSGLADGYLFDATGDDFFAGGLTGSNGGERGFSGSGYLFNGSGNDRYEAKGNGSNGSTYDSLPYPPPNTRASGMLLDAQGDDSYEDPDIPEEFCRNCSVDPKGGKPNGGKFGRQVDSSDLNPVLTNAAGDPDSPDLCEDIQTEGSDPLQNPLPSPVCPEVNQVLDEAAKGPLLPPLQSGPDPMVSIVGPVSVAEGNPGGAPGHPVKVTARLSRPSAVEISVDFETVEFGQFEPGHATGGEDFERVSRGTIVFPPGQVVADASVTIFTDSIPEPDETFAVDLVEQSAHFAVVDDRAKRGVVTIENDDGPAFFATESESLEGNAGLGNKLRFSVGVTEEITEPVSVHYRSKDGSASRTDDDYVATGGVLRFVPGESPIKTVDVDTIADEKPEADEEVWLELFDSEGLPIVGPGAWRGTILNDDGIRLKGDISLFEGDTGTVPARFDVTLSQAATEAVTVDFATADGTAGSRDYAASSGRLVFLPGETTKPVDVLVNGDEQVELDESFSLQLSNASGMPLVGDSAEATIRNDDVPGVSVGDVSLPEGQGGTTPFAVPIVLSQPSPLEVSIDFKTKDGSALAASDYEAKSGTVTFGPGEIQKTVNLDIAGDLEPEPDEEFLVELDGPQNSTIKDGKAEVVIADDDHPFDVRIARSVQGREGNVGASPFDFRITLSTPSPLPIEVDYESRDGESGSPARCCGAGEADYEPARGSVTFLPGETEKTVKVKVAGDWSLEADEDFLVELSNARYALRAPVGVANPFIAQGRGAGTILNDDRQVAQGLPRPASARIFINATDPYHPTSPLSNLLPGAPAKDGEVRSYDLPSGKPGPSCVPPHLEPNDQWVAYALGYDPSDGGLWYTSKHDGESYRRHGDPDPTFTIRKVAVNCEALQPVTFSVEKPADEEWMVEAIDNDPEDGHLWVLMARDLGQAYSVSSLPVRVFKVDRFTGKVLGTCVAQERPFGHGGLTVAMTPGFEGSGKYLLTDGPNNSALRMTDAADCLEGRDREVAILPTPIELSYYDFEGGHLFATKATTGEDALSGEVLYDLGPAPFSHVVGATPTNQRVGATDIAAMIDPPVSSPPPPLPVHQPLTTLLSQPAGLLAQPPQPSPPLRTPPGVQLRAPGHFDSALSEQGAAQATARTQIQQQISQMQQQAQVSVAQATQIQANHIAQVQAALAPQKQREFQVQFAYAENESKPSQQEKATNRTRTGESGKPQEHLASSRPPPISPAYLLFVALSAAAFALTELTRARTKRLRALAPAPIPARRQPPRGQARAAHLSSHRRRR